MYSETEDGNRRPGDCFSFCACHVWHWLHSTDAMFSLLHVFGANPIPVSCQLVGSVLTGLLLAGCKCLRRYGRQKNRGMISNVSLSAYRIISACQSQKSKQKLYILLTTWGVDFLGSNLFGEGLEGRWHANNSTTQAVQIGGSSWLDANDAVLNGAGGEVPQFFGATGLQHPGIWDLFLIGPGYISYIVWLLTTCAVAACKRWTRSVFISNWSNWSNDLFWSHDPFFIQLPHMRQGLSLFRPQPKDGTRFFWQCSRAMLLWLVLFYYLVILRGWRSNIPVILFAKASAT